MNYSNRKVTSVNKIMIANMVIGGFLSPMTGQIRAELNVNIGIK